MSIAVMSYVWEHSTRKGTELLLLLAIADYANERGIAFPSVATLARRIRMTDRNVQRALRKLRESGELRINMSAGPKGAHLYQVVINETLPLFLGDKVTPDKLSPDSRGTSGVTTRAQRGDTATSPEPSGTVREPSRRPPPPPMPEKQKGKRPMPVGFAISDSMREWARENKFEPFLEAHFAYFTDYARSNGKQYADWDGAFRNCVRADWGDVRKNLLRSGFRPAVQRVCQEIIAPGQICGLDVPVGAEVCEHHERKRQDATRRPMPAAARAAVDSILKRRTVDA
jgi:hypothetical protein